jgi:L,D-transpeptidase ErfK/SrfK
MKIHNVQKIIIALGLNALITPVFAGEFALPASNDSVVGQVQYIKANRNDTTVSVAKRYNLGLNAVIAANSGVAENSLLPQGYPIKISTEFLLPPLPRNGIIINLPEMRMYYFPAGGNEVLTFPVGIGRIGKTIPIKNTIVVRKVVNPTWTPTADIRRFNEEQGVDLPRVMPSGPNNPLGPFAIYLQIPTYLIHSTIYPDSVGRRASFGCIRMNEWDIKQFFPTVTAGLHVAIIDMPTKVAWQGGRLFVEAHQPLEERSNAPYAGVNGVVNLIEAQLTPHHVMIVDWDMAAYLTQQPDGLPHEVGIRVN